MIIILYIQMISSMFEVDDRNAYNYATLGAASIGHEIIYGFDATVAYYNEKGEWETFQIC